MAFAIIASIMILLLMQAFSLSWAVALAFFLTLPGALLGGLVVALLMGGVNISLGAMAGLVGVFAIASRNGLLLLGRGQQLEADGQEFGPDLVRQATRERFVPILTSAVTTALFFAPIMFFGNVAGLELVSPMAAVVLGGLVTSTLYSLVGLPALYALFGAAREPELGLPPVSELIAESPGFAATT